MGEWSEYICGQCNDGKYWTDDGNGNRGCLGTCSTANTNCEECTVGSKCTKCMKDYILMPLGPVSCIPEVDHCSGTLTYNVAKSAYYCPTCDSGF